MQLQEGIGLPQWKNSWGLSLKRQKGQTFPSASEEHFKLRIKTQLMVLITTSSIYALSSHTNCPLRQSQGVMLSKTAKDFVIVYMYCILSLLLPPDLPWYIPTEAAWALDIVRRYISWSVQVDLLLHSDNAQVGGWDCGGVVGGGGWGWGFGYRALVTICTHVPCTDHPKRCFVMKLRLWENFKLSGHILQRERKISVLKSTCYLIFICMAIEAVSREWR